MSLENQKITKIDVAEALVGIEKATIEKEFEEKELFDGKNIDHVLHGVENESSIEIINETKSNFSKHDLTHIF